MHPPADPQFSASASSVLLREKILKKCRDDMYQFLNHENGQVAIYDAVNALASSRRSLAQEFAKHEVQVLPLSSALACALALTHMLRHYLSSHFVTMSES